MARVNKKGSQNKPKSNAQSNKHAGKRGRQNDVKREQPKKDSKSPRVNYDNAREDKVADQIMKDAKSGKFNDINDFLKNPTLVRAAASIPTFPILGTAPTPMKDSVPGIMTIEWVPSFGQMGIGPAQQYDVAGVTTKFSPPPLAMNQAADSMYSFLVHANSRNYNYNSSDLMLLILAGANVFAIIEAMKRAYGRVKTYVETSRYTPDSELYYMGFDADDMRKNFSRMWFDINLLITQTRQIWVPTTIPYVTRLMDLNSNMYKDSDGPYAQLYIYVQSRYYIYKETFLNTGGMLAPLASYDENGNISGDFRPGHIVGDKPLYYTWSTWVRHAQEMIDALVKSEDRGIIYGDILNAYTAEKIMALPEISADYVVEPEYSPEISMQIENTIVWHNSPMNSLVQIENRLVPAYFGQWNGSLNSPVPSSWSLNFHTTSDPTPEMYLLATRFQTLGALASTVPNVNYDTASKTYGLTALDAWVPACNGSEIVVSVNIVYGLWDSITTGSGSIKTNITMPPYSATSSTANLYQYEALSMSFDWHPFVTYGLPSASGWGSAPKEDAVNQRTVLEANPNATYGDHDKYTTVLWSEVRRVNDVAELSLFGVPHM